MESNALREFGETEEPGEKSLMKVGIAIPTYNENVSLQPLVGRLLKVFQDNKIRYHITIVDDNSTDGTGELADRLARKNGDISVIHRSGKLGLGSAYKEAFESLLSDPQVTVVMEMDGDLSHEPEYIPNFIGKIEEGFDVVVGSRYTHGGGIGKEWSPLRRIISKSANLMTFLVVGLKVKDATSGFRAYESYALKTIDLTKVRTNGYAFQIDMLQHCRNAGCEIAEVPIIFQERKHGKSKLGALAILEFLKTLENSFIGRIWSTLQFVGLSSSIWMTNALWIGIKPLRVAIRKANTLSLSNRGLTKQNVVFLKNNQVSKRSLR
jgi:dolichol-phosphate mannosyltransferase